MRGNKQYLILINLTNKNSHKQCQHLNKKKRNIILIYDWESNITALGASAILSERNHVNFVCSLLY